MAYTSAINQRNLPNILYNVTVELAPTNSQAIASEAYVNSEVSSLQDSIDVYTEALTTLTDEYNALYDQYQILQAISTNIIGSVIFLASDTAPANYFLCDGSPLDVDTYINLFTVIQYRYGGSGNLFYLPDFENRFVVGANQPSDVKSNIATGNNFVGATNTYDVYGGIFLPVIVAMPPHQHDISGNTHSHGVTLPQTIPTGIDYGPLLKQAPSGQAGYSTGVSQTGISVLTTGVAIQQTDPNSNLAGVNVTPPFVALNAFICYQIN
jgi:microcystin-dependent protein